MEDNRSICKKRGIGEDTRGFGKMGRGKEGRVRVPRVGTKRLKEREVRVI